MRRESLFKFLSAIAITAGPRFCSVFVAATAAGMCVLYAEQLEILFPVRAFLSERRIAKACLNPGGDTLIIYPSLLHVVHVFVACDGTFPKRSVFDCAKKRGILSRFYLSFNQIAHDGAG